MYVVLLKWYVFWFYLGIFKIYFRQFLFLCFFRSRIAAAFLEVTASGPWTELHPFGDYFRRLPLNALFILPGTRLQPPFYENGTPFLQELIGYLGLPPPNDDVVKFGSLLFLSGLVEKNTVGRDAERTNRLTAGRLPEFRISCEIPKYENFIQVHPVRKLKSLSFMNRDLAIILTYPHRNHEHS